MILKSLELSGFKSFPKKTELEFKTSITAIVGPNGSGKSNIAEAFRFVLGEQSMKSMRGRRTEDLIWNGSQDIGRSNRAAVKLALDNKDKIFDVDFGEVSIERIIHRDASNEYRLNDSTVRLKDITEMVTSANIGSSGHHIISQGEADRVLNVSPKERKGMIEDALGLKIYELKKEESQRKLLRTEENAKEVSMLRREIAPHIKFLSRQVEKINQAEEMRAKLKELYREYFKRESVYISFNKERLDQAIKNPTKELADIEEKLEKAKKSASKDEFSSPLMDEIAETEDKLAKLRTLKSEYGRDLGRLEGEIAVGERSLEREERLRQNLSSAKISTNELGVLRDKLQKHFENLSEESFSISSIREAISRVFDEFLKSLGGEKHSDDDELDSLKREIQDIKKKKMDLEEKLQEALKREEELTQLLASLRSRLEEEKDTYREAEKEVYRLQAMRSEIRAKRDEIRAKLNEVTLEEDEMKRELGEAGVLVGKDAISFEEVQMKNTEGKILDEKEIAEEDRPEQKNRQKEIERLKIRLEEMGGEGSEEDILSEYKEATERDLFLENELNDLKESRDKLRELIDELEETVSQKFEAGLDKINKEFEKFFSLMFGGGKAALSIVEIQKRGQEDGDSDEPAEEGVEISVALPHKKIRGLEMLSGGERALTSIALIFAMSQVNPPPFIILDETDAALDEANSKRYGDMIEALSKDSQLILITHNRETMSRAGVLYGVTMSKDGASRLLSVEFEEAVEVAK